MADKFDMYVYTSNALRIKFNRINAYESAQLLSKFNDADKFNCQVFWLNLTDQENVNIGNN